MYPEYLEHYGIKGMKWRNKKVTTSENLSEVERAKDIYKTYKDLLKKKRKKDRETRKLKKYKDRTKKIKGYLVLSGSAQKAAAFLEKYKKTRIH